MLGPATCALKWVIEYPTVGLTDAGSAAVRITRCCVSTEMKGVECHPWWLHRHQHHIDDPTR